MKELINLVRQALCVFLKAISGNRLGLQAPQFTCARPHPSFNSFLWSPARTEIGLLIWQTSMFWIVLRFLRFTSQYICIRNSWSLHYCWMTSTDLHSIWNFSNFYSFISSCFGCSFDAPICWICRNCRTVLIWSWQPLCLQLGAASKSNPKKSAPQSRYKTW